WSTNGDALTVGASLTGAGALTATGSETITVGANFSPTSFTPATSTVTLNTAAAASVSGLSFYNLVINKSAQADIVTSTGAWTVTNSLTMTQGTWAASTFAHTIAGAWNSLGGTFTFTAGTSTITLSPTANPTITTKGIGTDPFYNLSLASGGSLATDVQATNNLTITAGTLALNGHNLSVGVNLTGNALTASASEAITVGGNWNVATFTPATSTVTFTGASGAGPFTVTSNSQSFSTVVLNAAGKIYEQAAGATGVANITLGLTLTAGTWSTNGDALTVGTNLTGAGALTATGSEAITVGANFSPASFTPATSTVTLNTAAAASVSGLSFYNLVINKSAQADIVTSSGAWTVTNSLTMTQGTWAASTFAHTIAGAWNSLGGTFTFTAGTSTITLSPTANPTITTKGIGTDPFYNLSLASGGSLATDVQATNNLTITAGTLALNGHNLSVGVNLTGNALTASASEAITVGGNWNVATFTPATSTVTFTGASGAGPFTVTSNSQSFSTVVLNAAGKIYEQAAGATGVANITLGLTLTAGTWSTNGDALTVGTNLTGAGALTASASEAITVGGNWNVATFTPATSTVTFTGGSGAGPFTVTSNGQSFSTVVLNAVGKIYEQAAGATGVANITLALTLTAGTWSTNGDALTVGTSLTGAGALTATGSETITVGASFTPASFAQVTSTVVLNTAGAASVSGLTFYNLTI